jgi:hypothetical protein
VFNARINAPDAAPQATYKAFHEHIVTDQFFILSPHILEQNLDHLHYSDYHRTECDRAQVISKEPFYAHA